MTALIAIPRYAEVEVLILACGHTHPTLPYVARYLLTGCHTWYCPPCGVWRVIRDKIVWKP
jgi:hypothetical protein